jgi:hypothetical protein
VAIGWLTPQKSGRTGAAQNKSLQLVIKPEEVPHTTIYPDKFQESNLSLAGFFRKRWRKYSFTFDVTIGWSIIIIVVTIQSPGAGFIKMMFFGRDLRNSPKQQAGESGVQLSTTLKDQLRFRSYLAGQILIFPLSVSTCLHIAKQFEPLFPELILY